MFGVIGFEAEAFLKGKIVAAANLPVASDAWLDGDDEVVSVTHGLFFGDEIGTVADDRHLSEKNINKLGNFVNRKAAKDMADWSNTRILFEFMIALVFGF